MGDLNIKLLTAVIFRVCVKLKSMSFHHALKHLVVVILSIKLLYLARQMIPGECYHLLNFRTQSAVTLVDIVGSLEMLNACKKGLLKRERKLVLNLILN